MFVYLPNGNYLFSDANPLLSFLDLEGYDPVVTCEININKRPLLSHVSKDIRQVLLVRHSRAEY